MGGEVILPILMLLGLTARTVFNFVQRRRRLRGWQEVAQACGLQVAETSSVLGPQLTARAGQVTVTLEAFGSSTRIVLRGPVSPSLYAVSIRREPLLRRDPGLEIGDASFDKAFLLEGPAPQLLSLLDAETRRLLINANAESRLSLSVGTIQADGVPEEKVPYVLPLLLDICRRLSRPEDIPRRLAENVIRDAEAGVRLRSLLALIREHPGAPETAEALRTAISDSHPRVRLRAARALGAEGHELLLDLAESLEDDNVSAEAVSALDRELPFERAKAILDHALDGSRPRTVHACLEALGRSGDPAAAEPVLIDALRREPSDLRVAAANALGHVGSVAAVLPLQEATAGSWRDRGLHQATLQAIAEIQSRLQGASPGQLSIAEAEGGQLSMVSSEVGQVSLAVEPFPLPPEEPEQSSGKAREGPAARPV
jgi:HEAT repeat protein